MSEATMSYSLDNDRRFRNAMTRCMGVVSDLRVPFTLILADFYRSQKAIFALKGPGQYPPFKHSVIVTSLGGKGNAFGRKRTVATSDMSPYQRAKIKAVGFDYPLLVRSGKLAASLTDRSAPGAVASVGPTELIIGTAVTNKKGVDYPKFHQSDEPRTVMPLRKFLFIGPEALAFATSDQAGRPGRWMNILNDYALKALKAQGAFA